MTAPRLAALLVYALALALAILGALACGE